MPRLHVSAEFIHPELRERVLILSDRKFNSSFFIRVKNLRTSMKQRRGCVPRAPSPQHFTYAGHYH